MKKLYLKENIVIILVLLCLLSNIVGAYHSNNNFNGFEEDFDWVVMMYLNGDNVLSAAQGQILEEIRQVGSTDEVQFTILIDQNQDDDTRLYYLVGNTLQQQTWETESSMDDADTIKDYVLQVKSDFSADHYELIISSNKGSAWQGICWDDHGDGIMITMPELVDALNEITNDGADKLDILGIETCMTGNMEVAYQVKNCVDIFMAYPECALIGDWPYSEAFEDLIATPSMNPSEYAIVTVGYFEPQNYPQYDMITTMAATDLSYLDDLSIQIDDLATEFFSDIEEYESEITSAIESTRIYALLWDIDYYIDFYDFLDLLTISNPEIIGIINNITDILDTAVIANEHLPDDPVHGLSIYLPRRTSDYNNSLRYDELPSPYEETLFAIDTHWDEFLKMYLGIYNNQAPEIPDISGDTKGKPGNEYSYSVVTNDPEENEVFYFVDWDDETIGQWIGPFNSGEEVMVNHTWEKKGTYDVKVKAKDTLNAESEWGKLEVKMPFILMIPSSRIILIGRISNLEKTEDNNFRFLPINLIVITKLDEQPRTMGVLGETYGPYPCCGYVHRDDFKGIFTNKLVFGIWLLLE